MTARRPVPQAQRTRASEARSIASGSARIPGGLLPPKAAHALDHLLAQGYAPSKASVISRALIEACDRHSSA